VYLCLDAKSAKKMNYELSFQERAKLGMEQLSKQPPVTLAMAANKPKISNPKANPGTRNK